MAPQRRTVARASVSSLAAPRAELVDPFRSRAAAINGAEQRGRDDREQRIQPFDAGVAASGALLGIPVGLADGVVDVDDARTVRRRAVPAPPLPAGE